MNMIFSAIDTALIIGIGLFSIVGIVFTLNCFVDRLQKDLAEKLRKDIEQIK